MLKKLGYEDVDVAQNGLEVIDKLESGIVYDVILVQSFTGPSILVSFSVSFNLLGINPFDPLYCIDGCFYASHGRY